MKYQEEYATKLQIEEFFVKNSVEHVAYREFRTQVISELSRRDRQLYAYEQMHLFKKLRDRITAFREHLDYYTETILQNTPEAEDHIRKALRIPQQIPLRVTKMMKFGQYLMGFLPDRLLVFRAKMLICPVGSYEGRAAVYRLNARRTFFGEDYSETFDYAIRHLPTDGMFSVGQRMRHVDIPWMQDTGCVAVAFPAPSGQGFMSNHKDIEDYIEDNYIKSSEENYYFTKKDRLSVNLRHVPRKLMETFYAYETGSVSADALYIIWHAGNVKGTEAA